MVFVEPTYPPQSTRGAMLLIVDRSGSMQSLQEAMSEGINSAIAEQRNIPNLKLRVTLVQFDGVSTDTVFDYVKLGDTPPYRLVARDSTPLLDAMGDSLTNMRTKIAMLPPGKSPTKRLCMIITDGLENASNHWSRSNVMRLVEDMKGEGWVFTYLGANQDAIAVGQFLGVPVANSMTRAATNAGTVNSMRSAGAMSASYFSGQSTQPEYDSAMRQSAMEGDDEPAATPSTP